MAKTMSPTPETKTTSTPPDNQQWGLEWVQDLLPHLNTTPAARRLFRHLCDSLKDWPDDLAAVRNLLETEKSLAKKDPSAKAGGARWALGYLDQHDRRRYPRYYETWPCSTNEFAQRVTDTFRRWWGLSQPFFRRELIAVLIKDVLPARRGVRKQVLEALMALGIPELTEALKDVDEAPQGLTRFDTLGAVYPEDCNDFLDYIHPLESAVSGHMLQCPVIGEIYKVVLGHLNVRVIRGASAQNGDFALSIYTTLEHSTALKAMVEALQQARVLGTVTTHMSPGKPRVNLDLPYASREKVLELLKEHVAQTSRNELPQPNVTFSESPINIASIVVPDTMKSEGMLRAETLVGKLEPWLRPFAEHLLNTYALGSMLPLIEAAEREPYTSNRAAAFAVLERAWGSLDIKTRRLLFRLSSRHHQRYVTTGYHRLSEKERDEVPLERGSVHPTIRGVVDRRIAATEHPTDDKTWDEAFASGFLQPNSHGHMHPLVRQWIRVHQLHAYGGGTGNLHNEVLKALSLSSPKAVDDALDELKNVELTRELVDYYANLGNVNALAAAMRWRYPNMARYGGLALAQHVLTGQRKIGHDGAWRMNAEHAYFLLHTWFDGPRTNRKGEPWLTPEITLWMDPPQRDIPVTEVFERACAAEYGVGNVGDITVTNAPASAGDVMKTPKVTKKMDRFELWESFLAEVRSTKDLGKTLEAANAWMSARDLRLRRALLLSFENMPPNTLNLLNRPTNQPGDKWLEETIEGLWSGEVPLYQVPIIKALPDVFARAMIANHGGPSAAVTLAYKGLSGAAQAALAGLCISEYSLPQATLRWQSDGNGWGLVHGKLPKDTTDGWLQELYSQVDGDFVLVKQMTADAFEELTRSGLVHLDPTNLIKIDPRVVLSVRYAASPATHDYLGEIHDLLNIYRDPLAGGEQREKAFDEMVEAMRFAPREVRVGDYGVWRLRVVEALRAMAQSDWAAVLALRRLESDKATTGSIRQVETALYDSLRRKVPLIQVPGPTAGGSKEVERMTAAKFILDMIDDLPHSKEVRKGALALALGNQVFSDAWGLLGDSEIEQELRDGYRVPPVGEMKDTYSLLEMWDATWNVLMYPFATDHLKELANETQPEVLIGGATRPVNTVTRYELWQEFQTRVNNLGADKNGEGVLRWSNGWMTQEDRALRRAYLLGRGKPWALERLQSMDREPYPTKTYVTEGLPKDAKVPEWRLAQNPSKRLTRFELLCLGWNTRHGDVTLTYEKLSQPAKDVVKRVFEGLPHYHSEYAYADKVDVRVKPHFEMERTYIALDKTAWEEVKASGLMDLSVEQMVHLRWVCGVTTKNLIPSIQRAVETVYVWNDIGKQRLKFREVVNEGGLTTPENIDVVELVLAERAKTNWHSAVALHWLDGDQVQSVAHETAEGAMVSWAFNHLVAKVGDTDKVSGENMADTVYAYIVDEGNNFSREAKIAIAVEAMNYSATAGVWFRLKKTDLYFDILKSLRGTVPLTEAFVGTYDYATVWEGLRAIAKAGVNAMERVNKPVTAGAQEFAKPRNTLWAEFWLDMHRASQNPEAVGATMAKADGWMSPGDRSIRDHILNHWKLPIAKKSQSAKGVYLPLAITYNEKDKERELSWLPPNMRNLATHIHTDVVEQVKLAGKPQVLVEMVLNGIHPTVCRAAYTLAQWARSHVFKHSENENGWLRGYRHAPDGVTPLENPTPELDVNYGYTRETTKVLLDHGLLYETAPGSGVFAMNPMVREAIMGYVEVEWASPGTNLWVEMERALDAMVPAPGYDYERRHERVDTILDHFVSNPRGYRRATSVLEEMSRQGHRWPWSTLLLKRLQDGYKTNDDHSTTGEARVTETRLAEDLEGVVRLHGGHPAVASKADFIFFLRRWLRSVGGSVRGRTRLWGRALAHPATKGLYAYLDEGNEFEAQVLKTYHHLAPVGDYDYANISLTDMWNAIHHLAFGHDDMVHPGDEAPNMAEIFKKTLLEDAKDAALRAGVQTVRTTVTTLLVNFWLDRQVIREPGESDMDYAARRDQYREQATGFLATENGQSVLAYMTGALWATVGSGATSGAFKDFGDAVAKELRVAAGTNLLGSFVREVVAPMATTLQSGVPGVRLALPAVTTHTVVEREEVKTEPELVTLVATNGRYGG